MPRTGYRYADEAEASQGQDGPGLEFDHDPHPDPAHDEGSGVLGSVRRNGGYRLADELGS